jgi:hypothetical protein
MVVQNAKFTQRKRLHPTEKKKKLFTHRSILRGRDTESE